MIVYVFGNHDEEKDNAAILAAKKIKIPGIKFKVIAPHEDLPEEENLVVMDVVEGIREIRVIREIEGIELSPRTTVHDFDLGLQLKYLQKIGKLKKATIVGIPGDSGQARMTHKRLKVIFKKLVAQDIQGS